MARCIRFGIAGATGWMAGALAAGIEYEAGGRLPEKRTGRKSGRSRVTALCDLSREALQARKQDLGLESAACFTSYAEMLQSDSVDAVVVAVPNHLHVTFALQALEAGKHLFLEKPLATHPDDSAKLLRAAEESPVTTKLDYILLHYDEQEKLRELIRRGAFGELASTHFTYRHPIQASETPGQAWKLSREKSGGALPMGICHAVSATVFQVDSRPVRVICRSCPARLRPFDYDTQMDILIAFENGVVSLIQGNIDFAEKYDARHTVIGTEGQFDYNPYNPLESRVMWSSKTLGRSYSPDPGFAEHHLDSGDVWKHQCSRTIQDFTDHVAEGKKDVLLGLESAVVTRTEAVIWAAEESALRNGQPVDTPS